MYTLILSFWIHCIETHIAGSTCLKRESSIYIGGFWMEDYISCWLYKLKYTLVWHSLKPECYSACTKVLESGLGSHFFLYFLPKSPYLPIEQFFTSSPQNKISMFASTGFKYLALSGFRAASSLQGRSSPQKSHHLLTMSTKHPFLSPFKYTFQFLETNSFDD